MTQKKPVQKQKNDEEPDFFEVFRQEFGNNTYMRFYLQQDKFTFHPFRISSQNKLEIDEDRDITINLPWTRVISNTVSDTLILNKFVYTNSKIVANLMENGRQTILGQQAKKHLNWIAFLERKELIMLKSAFQSLSVEQQCAIQYTVLSISNLILKLGINISKLSCILTSKKNTTNFLSIPTLSILFLQYLMYTLFQTKQIVEQLARSQFLRQLPRITYIKFSQILNVEELLLLEIGQQSFFTKHSFIPLKNIQYLQFYEFQSFFDLQKVGSDKQMQKNIHLKQSLTKITQQNGRYKRLTKYDYIRWVNLRKSYGINSPFGFDILFLFRTIYINLIKDFNPDVIILVQDYDNTKRIMQPSIRALLITQLMEKITGKVFVMRQVGFKRPQEQIWRQSEPNNIKNTNDKMVDQSQQIIEKPFELSFPDFQSLIMKKVQALPLMTRQIQEKLNIEEHQNTTKWFNDHDTRIKKTPTKLYFSKISKIQEILRDDLSYIALALIQRNNFQSVAFQSHQYMHKKPFLESIIADIQAYWLVHYVISLDPKQSESKKQLRRKLQLSVKQISEMITNMGLKESFLYQNNYNYIHDLRLNKKVYLNYYDPIRKKTGRLTYQDYDQVHMYYGDQQTFLFIFRFDRYMILLQMLSVQQKNQQSTNFIALTDEQFFPVNQQFINSTYIITERYVYKGFGSSPPRQQIFDNGNQLHQNNSNTPNFAEKILRADYTQLLTHIMIVQTKQNILNWTDNKTIRQTRDSNQQEFNQNEINIQHSSRKPITKSKDSTSNERKNRINKPKYTQLHFQELNQCTMQRNTKIVPIFLIQKDFGWGMFDKKTNKAIFMGGHSHNCVNENKLNKYLHICSQKNQDINTVGKTTNQIFMGSQNPKARIPLYPFIYGIPFILGDKCYIVNTNGYEQSFTNSNKIFLTEFKMSSSAQDSKFGIVLQRKLFVNYEDQNQRIYIVTGKQFLVHYMVSSYSLKNVYQNRCVLQTLDEGTLCLELNVLDSLNGKNMISLTMETDKEQYNGFKSIKLFFNTLDCDSS